MARNWVKLRVKSFMGSTSTFHTSWWPKIYFKENYAKTVPKVLSAKSFKPKICQKFYGIIGCNPNTRSTPAGDQKCVTPQAPPANLFHSILSSSGRAQRSDTVVGPWAVSILLFLLVDCALHHPDVKKKLSLF